MQKLIAGAIGSALLGLLAVFVVPGVFNKIGRDLSDTEKYSARLSEHILDNANCEQYRTKILHLGKSAPSMNGTFTYAVVQVKEEANKAGCSKP